MRNIIMAITITLDLTLRISSVKAKLLSVPS